MGAGGEKASRLAVPLMAATAAFFRAVSISPSRLPGAAYVAHLLNHVRMIRHIFGWDSSLMLPQLSNCRLRGPKVSPPVVLNVLLQLTTTLVEERCGTQYM